MFNISATQPVIPAGFIKLGEKGKDTILVPIAPVDTLKERIEKYVDPTSGRYTVGQRALQNAEQAITKLGQNIIPTADEITGLIISYLASQMLQADPTQIGANPNFVNYLGPKENLNVGYLSVPEPAFQGFIGKDAGAYVSFRALEDAFQNQLLNFLALQEMGLPFSPPAASPSPTLGEVSRPKRPRPDESAPSPGQLGALIPTGFGTGGAFSSASPPIAPGFRPLVPPPVLPPRPIPVPAMPTFDLLTNLPTLTGWCWGKLATFPPRLINQAQAVARPNENSFYKSYLSLAIPYINTFTAQVQSMLAANLLASAKLADINLLYESVARVRVPTTPSTYTCVEGVDAMMLPLSPRAYNAIEQVASQFNFLESPGLYHNNIDKYVFDRTQGPYASLSSLAALFVRDLIYSTVRDEVIQPLFVPAVREGSFKNGYLTPSDITDKQSFLEYITLGIGELRTLAQWGFPDFGHGPLLQVFNAAPSFQGERVPKDGSQEAQICTALVVPQYRAIAQLAAIWNNLIAQPVALHLTLVGQGAFNNPQSTLNSAFAEMKEVLEKFAVNVYIHAYDRDGVGRVQIAAKAASLPLNPIMSATEFFSPAPLV
ncbi:MAG: hypothetical protein RLZ12_407 [Bacillota bacterium]